MITRRLIGTLLSGVACMGLPAYAQTESAAASNATARAAVAQADPVGLSEVIVTAQRREESAQRAAIAISVLQPEALGGVTNPDDIGKLAPAVQFAPGGGSAPLLYVRGVGTFAQNPYTDSAVAVNYDGIYLGRPTSTSGLFYDLERIEVLKGPQGTLYGRNATGGALNVIPAQPRLGERTVSALLGAGNYESLNAQGAVNLPLSSTVALRIAGTTYTHDGYNTDDTYKDRGTGGRAQLLIEPSSDLSIRLGVDYFDLGGTGPTGALLAVDNPLTHATQPVGLDASVGAYDPRSLAVFNSAFIALSGTTNGPLAARPYRDNQYYGFTTEVNAAVGSAELTFLGGWRRSDLDNIFQPQSFVIQMDETDEQYSAELRLAGKAGPVDWLGGLYYFDETVDSAFIVSGNVLGGVQTLDAKNESSAGFGRLTWNLTDTFRLTGAARYTWDDKSFEGLADNVTLVCTAPTHLCPNARRLPADLSNLPAALASIGYIRPPGVPVYIDATGTSQSIYSPAQIPVHAETSPAKATWRAAVEFEPRVASLLFASYETGYRSGGFSFSSITPVYAPETIDAYTIGAKNRFLDNRLQLNVEAFLWKYEDQQLSHEALGRTGGIEFVTENIGASTNQGIEIEVTAKPIPNTLLHADVQYLDAKNDRFVFSTVDMSLLAGLPPGTVPPATRCPFAVVPGTGTYSIDCSDLRALRAPEWTLNLGVQQTIPLSGGFDLMLEASTHYQSDSTVMFERRDFSVLEAYWLSDASVTLRSPDERWSVTAFVNNIEDERVLGNSYFSTLSGITTGNFGPPRTYGARVQFKL